MTTVFTQKRSSGSLLVACSPGFQDAHRSRCRGSSLARCRRAASRPRRARDGRRFRRDGRRRDGRLAAPMKFAVAQSTSSAESWDGRDDDAEAAAVEGLTASARARRGLGPAARDGALASVARTASAAYGQSEKARLCQTPHAACIVVSRPSLLPRPCMPSSSLLLLLSLAMAATDLVNTRWVLAQRPGQRAFDADQDCTKETAPVPALAPDEVCVQVELLSVDAFIRTMLDAEAYHGAIQLGGRPAARARLRHRRRGGRRREEARGQARDGHVQGADPRRGHHGHGGLHAVHGFPGRPGDGEPRAPVRRHRRPAAATSFERC